MSDGQGAPPLPAPPLSPLLSNNKLNDDRCAGYATASVEGRIAVEYFDPSPAAQAKKYAFKCHRHTVDDVDQVYPVNALAFHPVYNTFASAGSDATVSIWDHKVKKRLRQYPKFGNPVGALAFNCDGTRLAVGVGYNWDMGEKGMHEKPGTEIGVRKLGDEVKVRFALRFFFSVWCTPCAFFHFLLRDTDVVFCSQKTGRGSRPLYILDLGESVVVSIFHPQFCLWPWNRETARETATADCSKPGPCACRTVVVGLRHR
jgi:hypothetical protein